MKQRSTPLVWIFGALLHGALLVPAALLYWHDLSGIPDDGQVPVPMLPAFLFSYRSGNTSVWDWPLLRVWLLASLSYVTAPALVSALAKAGPRDGAMFATALLFLAWLVLPEPGVAHTDYVPSFTAETRFTGLLWLFALTSVGSAVGGLIRWRTGAAAPPER